MASVCALLAVGLVAAAVVVVVQQPRLGEDSCWPSMTPFRY